MMRHPADDVQCEFSAREVGRFQAFSAAAGASQGGIPRRRDAARAEGYSAARYLSFSHSLTWMRYSSHSRCFASR